MGSQDCLVPNILLAHCPPGGKAGHKINRFPEKSRSLEEGVKVVLFFFFFFFLTKTDHLLFLLISYLIILLL